MRWNEIRFGGGYRFYGFASEPREEILPWEGDLPEPAERDRLIAAYSSMLRERISRPSKAGAAESPIIVYSVEAGLCPRAFSVDFPSGGYKIQNAISRLKNDYPRRTIILLLGKKQRHSFARLFPGGVPREGIRYVFIDDRYPAHMPVLQKGLLFGTDFEARGEVRDEDGDGMIRLDELTRLYGEHELRWMLVALCGPGFIRNGYLRVPAGASWGSALAPFLREGGWRLVEDDPLTGSRISDLSKTVPPGARKVFALLEGPYEEPFPWLQPGIDRDSRFRVFISGLLPGRKRMVTSLQGEARACFSCGACSRSCPAGLYPQRIHQLVSSGGAAEQLLRFRIASCFGCGLCTYLCPAKIDLAGSIRTGLEKIEKNREELDV